jgi:hypothetical protein
MKSKNYARDQEITLKRDTKTHCPDVTYCTVVVSYRSMVVAENV